MSRQQEFDFGIPIPPLQPKRPDRVFFGLLLEAKYRSEFWATQRRLCDINGITGSLLLKERFHVSLQHVGDYKRLRSKLNSQPVGRAGWLKCLHSKSPLAMP